MQRTYELMFIVRPDITEEDLEKLVSTLESQITGAAGTVKNIERPVHVFSVSAAVGRTTWTVRTRGWRSETERTTGPSCAAGS